MKCKLLKRLRRKGRNKITITSVTTIGNLVVGMSYGYDDDKYSDLFGIGDTEDSVNKKAEDIYIKDYLNKRTK